MDMDMKSITFDQVRRSHKTYIMQHIIRDFLLPFEQSLAANISKAFDASVRSDLVNYSTNQFIRDALYWRKHYLNQENDNLTVKFDFEKSLKSMDTHEMMQIKYNLINLHRINEYLTSTKPLCNSGEKKQSSSIANCIIDLRKKPISIETLNFSQFVKPKLQMLDHFYNPNQKNTDRIGYICDILEFVNFSSMHNPIREIDLSDNGLKNIDLKCILEAISANKNCNSFSNITALTLEKNLLIGDNDMHQDVISTLFELIATKLPNLRRLILSQTSIARSVYGDINEFLVSTNAMQTQHQLEVVDLTHCRDIVAAQIPEGIIGCGIAVLCDSEQDSQLDYLADLDDVFYEFGFDCSQSDEDFTGDDDDIPKRPGLVMRGRSWDDAISNYRIDDDMDMDTSDLTEMFDDDGFVYIG